jgi:DNA-binding response OmpR family regulator
MHLNFMEKRMSLPAFTIPAKCRILLVDDEPAIRQVIGHLLERSGFEVETACCALDGKKKLNSGIFDLVITDMTMENEVAGYEVILSAREQSYDPAVIVLSARPLSAHELAVEAILEKGEDPSKLLETVTMLLGPRQPPEDVDATQ